MLVLVLLPKVVHQMIQKLCLTMRWLSVADFVKKLKGQQQMSGVPEMLLHCCHGPAHLP